jgi:hypothetical protein
MKGHADLVGFETYDAEVRRLFTLLKSHGIDASTGSSIVNDAYAAFHLLYYHVFADERPSDLEGLDYARVQAGLGDIAAKINKAANKIAPATCKLHLEEMVKGSVRMNAFSSGANDPANKTSEFYLGCLAVNAGFKVEMEDPLETGGGKNPDLLLEVDGKLWAIAVKTIHGTSNRTIYCNIKSGSRQIKRTGRPGIVFVNMKNRIDNPGIVASDVMYPTPAAAVHALTTALANIANGVREDNVGDDWLTAFVDSTARPLVAFMGQTVLTADVGGRPLWIPIRAIHVLRVPPAPAKPEELTGLDAEAVEILKRINCQLQWNPPPSAT